MEAEGSKWKKNEKVKNEWRRKQKNNEMNEEKQRTTINVKEKN